MAEAGSVVELASFLPRFVNSVLILLKNIFWSTVLWLLEKLLLTDLSLQKQLHQLDEEAESVERANLQSAHTQPQLKVTEMKDKKLTINIKSATVNEDEDEDYDPPSSADIEVIHRKVPPKLHSILKQRTLSESSDDPGCSGGESPRSGQDECLSPDSTIRKSVSFNSHVDSATFKKNTAPTSMKTALKSKRRRARKKEEKKANSRRRRNSGSEGSSGEELSHTDSHSPSDKEEEDQFEQIVEDDEGEKAEGKKGVGISAMAGEGSVKVEKDNQDFRTSASAGSVVSEKKKAMVEEIKMKVAASDIPQASDSDDDEDDNDNGRTNSGSASSVNGECKSVCDGVSEMSVESPVKSPGDNTVSASTICNPGDLQQVIQSQDSSVIKIRAENKEMAANSKDKAEVPAEGTAVDEQVETMLSWKDQGDVQDLGCTDHRTQCAFSFSNSVIYDLDVD